MVLAIFYFYVILYFFILQYFIEVYIFDFYTFLITVVYFYKSIFLQVDSGYEILEIIINFTYSPFYISVVGRMMVLKDVHGLFP